MPDELCRLRELRVLDLSHNPHLRSLPEGLGELEKLEFLYTADQALPRLPNSIGHLCSLIYLNAGENNLESLPDECAQLGMLRELRLQANQITRLPEIFDALTSCASFTSTATDSPRYRTRSEPSSNCEFCHCAATG